MAILVRVSHLTGSKMAEISDGVVVAVKISLRIVVVGTKVRVVSGVYGEQGETRQIVPATKLGVIQTEATVLTLEVFWEQRVPAAP